MGEKLEPDSIMVNKQSPINTTENFPAPAPDGSTHKPSPLTYKAPKDHFYHVDKVLVTRNETESYLIKVRRLRK